MLDLDYELVGLDLVGQIVTIEVGDDLIGWDGGVSADKG
jgi:hypothetical protein